MNPLLKFVLTVTLLSKVDCQFGTSPDTCLDGHNKVSPSPDTEEYPECEEWQDLSCCTANDTRRIIDGITTPTLSYMRSVCGEFSSNCTKYQKAVGCWFYCEPMLYNFRNENVTQITYQAPICGQYCDDWFAACKDDMTCLQNWLQGFMDPDSRNCPANRSTCITYAEMFGDGEGLCNSMYSTSLFYQASNKDCMVMMFDGENPNIDGNPYGSANKVTSSLVVYLLGLWLFSHFL